MIELWKRKKGILMKNILKKLGFAGVVVLAGAGTALAAQAGGGAGNAGLCGLIKQMYGVFEILRTLAFVGAAFIIAGWAWGYITSGKGVDIEDLRKKGTGMLVGFILLFGIGIVLQFFLSSAGQQALGCPEILQWGMMS